VAQIFTPTSRHAAPSPVAGWQWQPFGNATYLARLRAAVAVIDARVKKYAPCNAAFSSLPGGRTFADVWADPSVWICYDPGAQTNRYGATLANDVTLSQYTCRMGQWTIAATLIHELAHVNGASGHDAAAEKTLVPCLMGHLYDPHIIGRIDSACEYDVVVAINQELNWGGSDDYA
jgi:hypothetical protein